MISDTNAFMRRCLKERQIYVWLDASSTITSWDNFRTKIHEEFGEKFISATVHQNLVKRRKRWEESYHGYVLQMRAISSQGDIEEEVLIQYIIDGIPDTKIAK